jgi:hypothetical protein
MERSEIEFLCFPEREGPQGRAYILIVRLERLKLRLLWNMVIFPLLAKSVDRIWRFVLRLLTVCSKLENICCMLVIITETLLWDY